METYKIFKDLISKGLLVVFLTVGFSGSLFASSGINSLSILDENYIVEDIVPNKALSLLMAKASNIVYKDNLSIYDKNFFEDNGFENLKLNTHSLTGVLHLTGVEFLTATKNIIINRQNKKVVLISFRGTAGFKDLYTDISSKKDEFFEKRDLIVHEGFNKSTKKFKDYEEYITIDNKTLRDIINSKDENTIFLLTGHSLGGAIAKLYSASLYERGINSNNILVYTFGAPPVGYDNIQNKMSFRQTYRLRTKENGTIYKGIKVVEYRNFYDPIANLGRIYFKDGSLLNSMVSLQYSFNEQGTQVNGDIGCKYIGTQSILNTSFSNPLQGIIDSFTNELAYNMVNKDLPNCDYTMAAHSLDLYINNLYKNIDFYNIAQNKISKYDGKITLDDKTAKNILDLIQNPIYKNAVYGITYNSNKLSNVNKRKLIINIAHLGVGTTADSFGQDGKDIRATINNMVQARQVNIDELKELIDDVQELDSLDYTKLAWGTALNIGTSAAEIISLGSANAAIKGAKLSTSLGKFGKYALKLKGPLKNAYLISQSKSFVFVKYFVELGFTVNDEMMNIINTDEATSAMVNSYIGINGDLTKATLEVAMNKNKNKFLVFFIGKVNDLVVNIIKGGTQTIVYDKELHAALDELLVAIKEMTPIVGSWYAQWNMAKKISNDIDKKPKVLQAWKKYFNAQENLINDIKLLGNNWLEVRLDAIINNAIKQIKENNANKDFSDINKNYWAKKYIDILSSRSIIHGYENGEFKPKNNVSIGEFLGMSTRAIFDNKFKKEIDKIKDINNVTFSKYVEFLHDKNIDIDYSRVKNYSSKILEQSATREYIAKVLTNMLIYKKENMKYFKLDGDWDTYSDYLNKMCISQGKKDELHTGYMKYAPKDNITRDEVSVMIVKAMNIKNGIKEQCTKRKKYSFQFNGLTENIVTLSNTYEQLTPKWKKRVGLNNTFSSYLNIKAYEGNKNMLGDYQCTDLIKRFYKGIFNMSITSNGNGKDVAKNIVKNSKAHKLLFKNKEIVLNYYKNKEATQHPVNGSIISFDQNNNGIGHVAIAKYTSCNKNQTKCEIYLFEQNYVYNNSMAYGRKAVFTKDSSNKWSGIVDGHQAIGWTIATYKGAK